MQRPYPAPYPAHWEADVVLADGGRARVRPIRPDDSERLRRFHSRLSEESLYQRFFAPYPRLSERDVEHFTTVDYDTRVALIATIGSEMVAVVRYETTGGGPRAPWEEVTRGGEATAEAGHEGRAQQRGEAEVAFIVADEQQGRGLGTLLLRHIAAAARERGISRFVADVLPTNRRMIHIFLDAGYKVERSLDEGVLHLAFEIAETKNQHDRP